MRIQKEFWIRINRIINELITCVGKVPVMHAILLYLYAYGHYLLMGPFH